MYISELLSLNTPTCRQPSIENERDHVALLLSVSVAGSVNRVFCQVWVKNFDNSCIESFEELYLIKIKKHTQLKLHQTKPPQWGDRRGP